MLLLLLNTGDGDKPVHSKHFSLYENFHIFATLTTYSITLNCNFATLLEDL